MTFFLHENLYRDLAPVGDRQVTICGAGALGANLAETLVRMGLRRLRVIDRDRIEAHNLSTQPWAQQDIGAAKVRVLANMLYRAVGARVVPQHINLSRENALALLAESAVVIDAFDNLPSRAAVAEAAKELGTPCLHIALDSTGSYGCGLWDETYPLALTDNGGIVPDTCDYPLTRPLAQLVAAAAAEVLIGHLLDGSRRSFECTLRDLRLTGA